MTGDQRTTFRVMSGLPPYGPLAVSFPGPWGRTGQEGLVVEFSDGESQRWVGNFRPGFLSASRVVHHPDHRRVLVLSSGDLWVVDVANQSAEQFAGAVDGFWDVPDSPDLIVSRQGLALFRLGAAGVLWHTRRLSWDGFDEVVVTAELVRGLAWSPLDDRWYKFEVDTMTGTSSGGSFGETDVENWERLG
jgi:hypothetical protein